MNFKSLQNYEIFWTIRWQRPAQAAIACKNHVLIHFSVCVRRGCFRRQPARDDSSEKCHCRRTAAADRGAGEVLVCV